MTKTFGFSVMRISSVPKYMLLGYKVRLNDLGIFRYTFSGTGKATSEEVVHTDIKNGRIHYSPDMKLKSKMGSPEYHASLKKQANEGLVTVSSFETRAVARPKENPL